MRSTATPSLPIIPGATFVQSLDGIHEYRLDSNGLQVLLAPDPTTPVAGFMVTYRIGSRNEAVGYTGSTHLLEHLMFKGSENFNKKNGKTIWELLESKGAMVNATTWNDRTNYFSVMPSSYLSEAIALEADRMRRAFLTEEDRQSEMPIVRNEFERGENHALEALDKQLWATAYQAHPYHHPTIGWKSDIEKVSIERLQQFYNDFYHPDNATVSVVGHFNPEETLSAIMKEFGAHPKGPALPPMHTEEPKQEGERRVTVKRAGHTNLFGIAHKIPSATHEDVPALILLSLVLSDGKTSRLYRAFVDTALATDVNASCYQFHDPSLFMSYITLTPKVRHETIEKKLKQEYAKLITRGITPQELARAKRSIRAYIATRRDGPYALLSSINEEIAVGDWTRFVRLPQTLARVTAKEVQKAAKKYLVEDQSTVGYFIGTDA